MSLEDLESVTVDRSEELAALDAALRHTGPGIVLLGPPGAGKTHLLSLALQRAAADPLVGPGLAVGWFLEGAYGTCSYRDLLCETLSDLAGERAAMPELRALTDDELEARLAAVVGRRTLVLAIERMERLLGTMGQDGLIRLGTLMRSTGAVVVGSATRSFPALSDAGSPLAGLVRTHQLVGWSAETARQYLLGAARVRGGSDQAARQEDLRDFIASDRCLDRLRALVALAGGSPRLFALIATGNPTPETLDDLAPALLGALDRLTPAYQGAVGRLAPTRAALVLRLAHAGGHGGPVGALTVKALAEAVGGGQTATASALGQLEKWQVVRSFKTIAGDRRLTFYELADPLLRMWLSLRSRDATLVPMIHAARDQWATGAQADHGPVIDPGWPPARVSEEAACRLATGEQRALVVAVLGARLDDSAGAPGYVRSWRAAFATSTNPYYQVAARILAASAALLDGDLPAFFALPLAERCVAARLIGVTVEGVEAPKTSRSVPTR